MSIQRYAVIETPLCIGGDLHDGEVLMVRADDHDRELAALREELYQAKEARDREMLAGVRLQRDLVAAEQQNEKLVGILKEMRSNQHTFISFYRGALDAALKPTESGAINGQV